MDGIVNVNPTLAEVDESKHIEEMIAKADAGTGTPTDVTNENTSTDEKLLAGKYKSEEELSKGILELLKKQKGGNLEDVYKDLESHLGEGKGDKQESKQQSPEDAKIPDDPNKVAEELSQKGLDLSKFSEEFNANGKLSDDSYAALDKAGISKAIVDTYIEGQQAKVAIFTQKIYDAAGGEDTYKSMINWAATNLSEGEKQAYNDAIGTLDSDKYMLALSGLVSKYRASVGNEPKLVTGTSTVNTNGTYSSWDEVKLDMKSPRYAKDPSFRKQVESKLQSSHL